MYTLFTLTNLQQHYTIQTLALQGLQVCRVRFTTTSVCVVLITVVKNNHIYICSDNPDNTPTTRAMARGVPPTIYAKTSAYYNSFLPKTVREIKK